MRALVISCFSIFVYSAASAGSAPPGTVFRCWNPKTHKVEVAQQQFARCDGVQTMVTPAGIAITLGEADPPPAQAPRVISVRQAMLLAHFPDEPSHRRARERALKPVLDEIRHLAMRVKELEAERPPLIEEAQFYIRKPLPAELRQKFDANDARMTAVRLLLSARAEEVMRINARYDEELADLKVLWAPAVAR